MRPRLVIALCLALAPGLSACRTAWPLNLEPNEHLPNVADHNALGLVVPDGFEAESIAVATERHLRVRLLATSHRILVTGEGIVDGLDADPLEEWPDAMKTAWAESTSACREHAGRPPWRKNPIAEACARSLAGPLWERLILSLDLAAVAVLTPGPDDDKLDGNFYVPGSVRTVFVRAGAGPDDAAAAVRWFLDGNQRTVGRRKPAFALPERPRDDDALWNGTPMTLSAQAVPGCRHPLPATIHVEAVRGGSGSSLVAMVERAWATLPAAHRAAPDASCRISASSWKGETGQRTGGGWLDCEGKIAFSAALVRDVGSDSATIELAQALVDAAVFNTCQFGP